MTDEEKELVKAKRLAGLAKARLARSKKSAEEKKPSLTSSDDPMNVLDHHNNEMSSAKKALIGIGTLMLVIAPIVIVLTIIYLFLQRFSEWLAEYGQNIFSIGIVVAAIIGVGNILFDIFSRIGLMRHVYTWIGKNITKPKVEMKEL